ncbi:RHO1 GDP-GTP exchange protein 2 [Blyttiomyces sp. JEL0837]|nr:RHO1 GDP-GTP exchange protein 2 [Blyttiomyces sp. JEL0837]
MIAMSSSLSHGDEASTGGGYQPQQGSATIPPIPASSSSSSSAHRQSSSQTSLSASASAAIPTTTAQSSSYPQSNTPANAPPPPPASSTPAYPHPYQQKLLSGVINNHNTAQSQNPYGWPNPAFLSQDTLASIIQTTDRNLALLVGRALDAQRFIHDVTFSSRLRDDPDQLFTTVTFRALNENDTTEVHDNTVVKDKGGESRASVAAGMVGSLSADMGSKKRNASVELLAGTLPNGVFTLLTDCYSPTCTSEQLCFSVTCPRRLEQLAHLPKGEEQTHWESKHSIAAEVALLQEVDKLQNDDWWSNTVPSEIVQSVTPQEEKRQNAIYDIIKTERNYVDELKAIQTMYAIPLRNSDVIEEHRKEAFFQRIFCNAADLLTVNSKLLQKLLQRQKEAYIVEKIGDIFLNIASELEIYVEYCGNREYSRNDIALEKATNIKFREFQAKAILKTDVNSDNKQELDGYLHKPIARMASYLLLLKAILDKTPEGHPDRTLIPQAQKAMGDVLGKMNEASGVAINKIKLSQLNQLINTDGYDLRLMDPDRRHHYEGKLVLKRPPGPDVPLTAFVFDHMFVMTREKTDRRGAEGETFGNKTKNYQYQLYKKPMPLELIVIEQDQKRTTMLFGPGAVRRDTSDRMSTVNEPKLSFGLQFLGRNGGSFTFAVETEVARNVWRDYLKKLRMQRQRRRKLFEIDMMLSHSAGNTMAISSAGLPAGAGAGGIVTGSTTGSMNSGNAGAGGGGSAAAAGNAVGIHCSAFVDDRLLFGADNGLFMGIEDGPRGGDLDGRDQAGGSVDSNLNHMGGWDYGCGGMFLVKVLDLERIVQVEVLKDYDMILVLSDKVLSCFPMDILDARSTEGPARRGKKIGENISFFKVGVCADRMLVCAVRATPLTSTIKVYEPVGLGSSKRRGKLGILFKSSNDTMRVFKEFYIPTEALNVHFLRTKICVGCTKGFEIVDLETLDTQGLLDPADSSLDFALGRENLRPIAIFRIVEAEYLICYNEFGFYVDRMGRKIKGDWMIHWHGLPTAFAYVHPYIIAFEPTFIEVRDVLTGELVQVIQGSGIRALNTHPDLLHAVMEKGSEGNMLFKLRRVEHDVAE